LFDPYLLKSTQALASATSSAFALLLPFEPLPFDAFAGFEALDFVAVAHVDYGNRSVAVVAYDQDPMYEEALRVVLEMGKASTSTLQRRLRLGYGRAARILDMMHRDGIIGPPDGSKPREVLKRPDWLRELDHV